MPGLLLGWCSGMNMVSTYWSFPHKRWFVVQYRHLPAFCRYQYAGAWPVWYLLA